MLGRHTVTGNYGGSLLLRKSLSKVDQVQVCTYCVSASFCVINSLNFCWELLHPVLYVTIWHNFIVVFKLNIYLPTTDFVRLNLLCRLHFLTPDNSGHVEVTTPNPKILRLGQLKVMYLMTLTQLISSALYRPPVLTNLHDYSWLGEAGLLLVCHWSVLTLAGFWLAVFLSTFA